MNSSRINTDHILIAEYTLGLLDAHELARAHALLGEDDAAVAAALDWEQRLLELTDLLPPVEPSPLLLQRIQAGLGHNAPPAPSNLYRQPDRQAAAARHGAANALQAAASQKHAGHTPSPLESFAPAAPAPAPEPVAHAAPDGAPVPDAAPVDSAPVDQVARVIPISPRDTDAQDLASPETPAGPAAAETPAPAGMRQAPAAAAGEDANDTAATLAASLPAAQDSAAAPPAATQQTPLPAASHSSRGHLLRRGEPRAEHRSEHREPYIGGAAAADDAHHADAEHSINGSSYSARGMADPALPSEPNTETSRQVPAGPAPASTRQAPVTGARAPEPRPASPTPRPTRTASPASAGTRFPPSSSTQSANAAAATSAGVRPMGTTSAAAPPMSTTSASAATAPTHSIGGASAGATSSGGASARTTSVGTHSMGSASAGGASAGAPAARTRSMSGASASAASLGVASAGADGAATMQDAIAITPPSTLAPAGYHRLMRSLWVWRGATAVFAALALALALIPPGPRPPPVNVIAVAPTRAAILQAPGQSSTPGWIVTFDPQNNVLMSPQVRSDVPADSAVQLWTYNDQFRQPRSMGLVDPNKPITVPASLMGQVGEQQYFEMTLEPQGGSRTASPSGPVLFIGQVVTFGAPTPANPGAAAGQTPPASGKAN